MDISLASIGIIHSSFSDPTLAPIQSSRSTATGSVEVFPQYVAGLHDLEEFSHIFLLYLIDCPQGYGLSVKPFLDDQDIKTYLPDFDNRENAQIGWYGRRARR